MPYSRMFASRNSHKQVSCAMGFQAFRTLHGVKLSTQFPFLKKDQIEKKVKELWKRQCDNVKQSHVKIPRHNEQRRAASTELVGAKMHCEAKSDNEMKLKKNGHVTFGKVSFMNTTSNSSPISSLEIHGSNSQRCNLSAESQINANVYDDVTDFHFESAGHNSMKHDVDYYSPQVSTLDSSTRFVHSTPIPVNFARHERKQPAVSLFSSPVQLVSSQSDADLSCTDVEFTGFIDLEFHGTPELTSMSKVSPTTALTDVCSLIQESANSESVSVAQTGCLFAAISSQPLEPAPLQMEIVDGTEAEKELVFVNLDKKLRKRKISGRKIIKREAICDTDGDSSQSDMVSAGKELTSWDKKGKKLMARDRKVPGFFRSTVTRCTQQPGRGKENIAGCKLGKKGSNRVKGDDKPKCCEAVDSIPTELNSEYFSTSLEPEVFESSEESRLSANKNGLEMKDIIMDIESSSSELEFSGSHDGSECDCQKGLEVLSRSSDDSDVETMMPTLQEDDKLCSDVDEPQVTLETLLEFVSDGRRSAGAVGPNESKKIMQMQESIQGSSNEQTDMNSSAAESVVMSRGEIVKGSLLESEPCLPSSTESFFRLSGINTGLTGDTGTLSKSNNTDEWSQKSAMASSLSSASDKHQDDDCEGDNDCLGWYDNQFVIDHEKEVKTPLIRLNMLRRLVSEDAVAEASCDEVGFLGSSNLADWI